jgi:hypothetical protein
MAGGARLVTALGGVPARFGVDEADSLARKARCTWVASPWRGWLATERLRAIEQACLGTCDGGMLSYAFIEVS